MKRPTTRTHVCLGGGVVLLCVVAFISQAIAQTCTPLPAGLVGWWPGNGNAYDIQNGDNGTLHNGATFAAGVVDQAFSFDGVDDYVSAPFNQVGPFTVAFWARANTPAHPEFTSLLSSAFPGHYDPFFQIELDGLGNYRVDAGNGQLFVSIGPATTTYQHIAVTHDGSDVRTYLNGHMSSSSTWTGSPLRFEVLKIGINRDENRPFSGFIDEVEIYNRALSLPEIQAIAGCQGFTFTGFFPPLMNPPVLNVSQAGQAIPVELSLNGDQGLNIFALSYPASQQINCTTDAPQNDVQQTVTAGGSGLTYDPSTDQYTYVWKTNSRWAGTCRQLIVRLIDGTDHVANFQFK